MNPWKSLFTSREFWVTLFTLFVLVVGQFMPGFSLDVGGLAALVLIVAAYLYGIAVDPGPGGWKGVIQSRKFWSAAIGVVFVFLQAFQVKLPVELTPELLVSLAVIIGTLIVNFAMQGPPPEVLRGMSSQYIVARKTTQSPPDETGQH